MPKLCCDSRQIQPGDTFICLPQGKSFIEDAKARGASEILTLSRKEMAHYAAKHFEHPSKHLTVIGVTGTNGKTTVTYLLHALLSQLGHQTALSGTLNKSLTTPNAIDIQSDMAQHLNNGGTHYVMEVSSHGIDQDRVAHIDFDVVCLTNITQDHLDYHDSFYAYQACKESFMKTNGRLASIYPQDFLSIQLPVKNPLLGSYNQKNLQAIVAIYRALGYRDDDMAPYLSTLKSPPGRFDPVNCGQPFHVIIDYAHTPDALKNVLITARELIKDRGQLICVFGCGGDRDRSKRPQMGAIASTFSDHIILTNDNPRNEDPQQIIKDIQSGITSHSKFKLILDRETAIKTAINDASPNDVILIAGKGHENYQLLSTGRIDFDDAVIATQYLKEKDH